jgi:hypothetical protein
MYNVDVLDFDGTKDAILQEYNRDSKKFMSYLEDFGHFEDVPLEQIRTIFGEHYPEFYKLYKDAKNIRL